MPRAAAVSRRGFLSALGAAPALAAPASPSTEAIGALRGDIRSSPVAVALHRARVFTRVFQAHPG